MPQYRTLIVEDHEEFRRFLCLSLQEETQCQIIGEVSDGLEAIRQSEQLQPDLILLDIGLPVLNGFDAIRRILRISPNSKILFVTENSAPDVVLAAFKLGGHGYLLKSDAAELTIAIETVLRGKQFLSSRFKTSVTIPSHIRPIAP
jgi:DNA-binding NarL/FixJ family response regulator